MLVTEDRDESDMAIAVDLDEPKLEVCLGLTANDLRDLLTFGPEELLFVMA